jgi:hypothetical protein
MTGAWDGEHFVVTVTVTLVVPVAYDVTFRLTAAEALGVIDGDPVESDGHANPATAEWSGLDGASIDELEAVDSAVKRALRDIVCDDADAAAAVEAAADGGEA